MPEKVTLRQAAQRLGLSSEEVRRRVRAGELIASEEPTAYGPLWLVELPSPEEPAAAPPAVDPDNFLGARRDISRSSIRRRSPVGQSRRLRRRGPGPEVRQLEQLLVSLQDEWLELRGKRA